MIGREWVCCSVKQRAENSKKPAGAGFLNEMIVSINYL